MEILKLIPACKNYIWGGEKLPERYGKNVDFRPVAESWELSFHKDGKTALENGKTLEEALSPRELGSACAAFPFFPVLIKLIDAKQNLSVQVHPDDDYALANENSFGKTEAWYIVEADEGAGIYLGFNRDVAKEELETAIREETLPALLNFYPVKAGAPAPPHTPCSRCRGHSLELVDDDHADVLAGVEKALRVANLKKYEKLAPSAGENGEEVLASCQYFHSTRLVVNGENTIHTDDASFKCLVCVRGAGQIGIHTAKAGDSFFVPAGYGKVVLAGDMELVCTEVR